MGTAEDLTVDFGNSSQSPLDEDLTRELMAQRDAYRSQADELANKLVEQQQRCILLERSLAEMTSHVLTLVKTLGRMMN